MNISHHLNIYALHLSGHYLFEIIEYLSYLLLIRQRLYNNQTALPWIKGQGCGLNPKEFSRNCREVMKFEVM